MEVDDAIKKLGFHGRWQVTVNLMLLLAASTPTAWHLISIVWIGYKPRHQCTTPANSSLEDWIPTDYNGRYSSCSMFFAPSNETTECLYGTDFDDDGSGRTVVTKWVLVCDRDLILHFTQMTFTCGALLGALVSTLLSLKLRRKLILILNLVFMSTFGILTVTAENLNDFFAYRFFVGFFQQGAMVIQTIYLMESLSAENRAFYILIGSAYWGLAVSVLPLIAYIAKNWVYFELFISIYGLVFLPVLMWWLPDTVVWLRADGKIEEAEEVLLSAAKMNNVTMNKPILKPLQKYAQNTELDNFEENKEGGDDFGELMDGKFISFGINKLASLGIIGSISKRNVENSNNHSMNPCSVIEPAKNRFLLRHMILALVMLLVNMAYIGITYISASLYTNHFLSSFLNGIVEVPACISIYFIINKLGKKRPIIFCQIAGAVAMVACILTAKIEEVNENVSYATLSLNLIYKIFISASNAVLFLYGIELFPTNLRTQALSICTIIGRIGTIVTAYATHYIEFYPQYLFAGFGIISLLAALLTMLLPETSKRALPETVEDIEAWYKNDSAFGYEGLSEEDED